MDKLFTDLFTRRQCIRLAVGHPKLDLFTDTEEDSALLGALDRVQKRFG